MNSGSRQPWEKRAHFMWSCCFMSDIKRVQSGIATLDNHDETSNEYDYG
jgi:hypothetical protein